MTLPESHTATTRERIIRATLAEIDRVGVDGLTIRGITDAAGVNSAAVNYHFGSKDRLLEEVLDRAAGRGLWGTLDELRGLIEDNNGDVRSGLEEYLSEFLPDLLAHPRRLAARLHRPLTAQAYDGPRVDELTGYLEGFLEIVGPGVGPGAPNAPNAPDEPDRPDDPEARRLAVVRFWSSILGLALMPRLFEAFTGPHALEADGLDRYVAGLLDGLLHS